MTVFSPTQTTDYQKCPAYWWARHVQKWVRKEYDHKEIGGAVGRGIHAGVATLLRGIGDGEADCKNAVQASFHELHNAGARVAPRYRESADSAAARAVKAMGQLKQRGILPDTWQVIQIEPSFPDHGNARPDAIIRDPHKLALFDLKTKTRLESRKEPWFLAEHDHKWQMMHYAWAASEVYGEEVWRYWIGLVVLEPRFEFEWHPYEIHPTRMQHWLASARQTWQDMQDCLDGKRLPYLSDACRKWDGKCEMPEACGECFFEPEEMRRYYVQLH